MSKRTDVNEPIGKLRKVKDFLPSPAELAQAEETQKVTIALTKSSIEFFKKTAAQNNTKYQRMIRNLLELYASEYSG